MKECFKDAKPGCLEDAKRIIRNQKRAESIRRGLIDLIEEVTLWD